MAQGTLGQQARTLQGQQQQGRVTRSQRVKQQQAQKKAIYEYNTALAEAERLRSEVFIDQQKQEVYYEYIPKRYLNKYGEPIRDWLKASDKTKQRIIASTRDRDLVKFERTKSYNDPFTFEEYNQEYEKLSPNVQQFFKSPTAIKEEKARQVQGEKDKATNQITQWQNQLQSEKASLERYKQWWDRKSSKEQERYGYDRYREGLRDRERDAEEYEDKIRVLQNELGKLDLGYAFKDLKNYAEDKADYKKERSEAKAKSIKQFNEKITSGELDKELVTLGLAKTGTDYKRYSEAVKSYNKNVEYMQRLQKWAGNVGYENISDFAKEKLTGNKETTEIPIYDAKTGKLLSIKSGAFGGSWSIQQYNEKVKKEQAKADKFNAIDTTLKLGGVENNYAVMTAGANIPPLTEDQQLLNEQYSKKSYIQAGLDWVKSTFGLDKPKEFKPPMEWVEQQFQAKETGGKSTLISTETLDPKSALYVTEMAKFNENADKLSENIFSDYENKLKALDVEEITPENVGAIKKEKKAEFKEQLNVYSADFSKSFADGLKAIERDASIKNWNNFGLGGVRSFYFGLEDKAKARKERLQKLQYDQTLITTQKNWLPNTYAGTLMSNQIIDLKSKGGLLSPSQSQMDTEALLDYKYYRSRNLSPTIARELVAIEQFGKGTYYGTKEAVYYNPRTILFKTGAFATVVGGATVLTTYSGGAGAIAGSEAVKMASAGLLGLWAGSVIVRTSVGSTEYERGLTFGDIVGKEILPLIAGGYIGRAVGTKGVKAWENYKTLKQKPDYIAPYKRVRMEVLKGEQNFPIAKQSKHLSEFQKAKFSLVTDEKGSKLKVTRKFKVIEGDLIVKSMKHQSMSYDPKKLFTAQPTRYPSSRPFTIDFKSGTIKFNKAMGYTKAEKLSMLKNVFGDQYSMKLLDGQFSLTKYLPKEAWNKFGVSAGSHATTSGRFVKVGERYIAGAGSSEVPAQYFSSEDSLYFALGKGQSTSLYGGSLFGSAVPKPYVEAGRSTGFKKIPKGYKPQMTKAEVIQYLKKYAPDYPLRTITRSQGSYWKETAYMIERGRTGELVVIGRKSEIEAGKLFGTVAERTGQKPYYTKVASPEIYKDLTKISRLGRTEYVWQVKPLTLKDAIIMKTAKFKPLNFAKKLEISWINKGVNKLKFKINYPTVNPILKYRIGDILMGRQIGSFKKMKIGEIVPIERYKSIPQTALEKEQHLTSIKEIMKSMRGSETSTFKQVSAQAIEENVLTKNIKEVLDVNAFSSSRSLPKSSLTYGEEYGSLISYPKQKYSSPSASYNQSYSYLLSSIRSLTYSDKSKISSIKSSRGSSPSFSYSSSPSYDYWSGSSYSGSSSSKTYTSPSYSRSLLFGSLKGKVKQKIKKQKTPDFFGLMPDFTSRALGLKPKEFGSVNDAIKEIGKIQTGFGIRTGGRVKGYKAFNERQVMAGIMK